MSTEAMKLALEAWQTSVYGSDRHHKTMLVAMTNMGQAIAEAETRGHGEHDSVAYIRGHEDERKAAEGQFTTMVEPSIHAGSGEKIGEKHHFTHRGQKQEQGEPVVWMAVSKSGNARFTDSLMAAKELTEYGWAVTPLYTTPQQSKFLVLTQEEFENDKGA